MKHQSGNVVIFILLAVGLFGALAFAFTRGGQQSQGNMNEQQAKIAAQEILDYAKAVEGAVNKLRSRGCSQMELSFDYDIPATTWYENPYSPVTEECHIFSQNGGKIPWALPQSAWLIPQSQAAPLIYAGDGYGMYNFPHQICIDGLGGAPCDGLAGTKKLIIGLKYLQPQVCIQLNQLLSTDAAYSTTPTTCSPAGDDGTYIGTFFNTGQFACSGLADGRMAACINSSRSGNTFYSVLMLQ